MLSSVESVESVEAVQVLLSRTQGGLDQGVCSAFQMGARLR